MTKLLYMSFTLIFVLVGCVNTFLTKNREPLPVTPSDSAIITNRNSALSSLRSLISEGIVASGQNVGHADRSLETTLMNINGRVPAVLGIDLGFGDLSHDFSVAIQMAADHAAAGGWVEISFHPPHPATSGNSWDKTPIDFTVLATPGSPTNQTFMRMISNLANFIQELKNRRVIVFLRPLHEMNGGWFWWGNDKSWPEATDWIALWKQIHFYLRETRILDNVLFVYAPNVRLSLSSKPVDFYYPGTKYVDVVGLDYYQDDLSLFDANSSLTIAASLGKPIGMGEVGSKSHLSSFDQRTWSGLVDFGVGSFIVWGSWPGHAVALRDTMYGYELLALTNVLDRQELVDRKLVALRIGH